MTRFTQAFPLVPVDDLAAELEYYERCLGFEVSWRFGEPAIRAGVARDGCELQLVEGSDCSPDPSTRVYFHVEGVDDYYARCVERGASIQIEVADRPFGMRDFRVTDRSGNILAFGEPLERPVAKD